MPELSDKYMVEHGRRKTPFRLKGIMGEEPVFLETSSFGPRVFKHNRLDIV